ncbi:MAG: 4Fe-4S dicluster domain-containing protein [Chloroflexia bacterium]|nr:4Fe-4S dicluster domain-containing protein [Chloroflexia bacterium]
MPIRGTVPVTEGDTLGTLRALLRRLLEHGVVDAILVPVATPDRRNLVPTLVSDPEQLAHADPIAPVMPVQSARVVSQLTFSDPEKRLAVVLKACEWRAVIELTKLRQVKLDRVLTIGVDCYGTYPVLDYGSMATEQPDLTSKLLEQVEPAVGFQQAGHELRVACKMCEHFVPEGVDVLLGLFGVDPTQEIAVELADSQAGLAELLGLQEKELSGRPEAIATLEKARLERRDKAFAAIREKLATNEGLLSLFSACIRCHNCTTVCPICYCKECIFRTPTFDHASRRYMQWAGRRGAVRLPTDTLLFQITRLNHMASSCVGCGLCEDGCPSNVPLTAIFRAIAQGVQGIFEYQAGRDLEEELPLATFREDELHVVER